MSRSTFIAGPSSSRVRAASRRLGSTAGRRTPTLGSLAVGRNNNLNLIRMIAASAVIITHAFPIADGPGAPQPLVAETGVSIGVMGLYAFFAISGYLIAESFERSRTTWHFVAARVLRLYPALVVVLLLTVLLLGPWTTTLSLSDYYTDPSTATYVPRNLSLAFLQYDLPGVFTTNPNPGAINGSLWTLVHEVACYSGLAALAFLGVLRSKRRLALALSLYGAFWITTTVFEQITPVTLVLFRDLSLPFVVGSTLYCLRDRVRLSWPLLAGFVLLVVVSGPTLVGRLCVVAAISYGVFVVGHRVKGRILGYNRLGDYSYGTYIYGFPVQQTLVWLVPGMTAHENWALSLVVAIGFAVVSWHVVEKPSLARKNALGAKMAALTGSRRARRKVAGPATQPAAGETAAPVVDERQA